MEQLESFINSMPIIKALTIVALGSLLWHGIRAGVDSYIRTRSKSLAEDVNLQAELRRLILNEEAKITTQRLNSERAFGAMKILRLLAEVDSKLTDWQLTAYFRIDELEPNETIEDLGHKDLKRISSLLIEIISESNAYVVLLGDEAYKLILGWVGMVHNIMFDYEAVFQTSKNLNIKLNPTDKQRVTTVSELLKREVNAKHSPIGEKRQEILGKLSQCVRSNLVNK